MREPLMDRSSVGRTADGMIRIRTPEGVEHILTPIRAVEWACSRQFVDALRQAAMDAPLPITVPEADPQ